MPILSQSCGMTVLRERTATAKKAARETESTGEAESSGENPA